MALKSTPPPHWPRSPCWMKRRRQECRARPDRPGPGSAGLLLGVGSRRRRRDLVVLGFRIEELAGSSDRFGGRVLIFLTGRDVLAALDALGLIGAAGDRHADAGLDFGMNRN